MVIGCIGRNAIRLSIDGTLAVRASKSCLAVSRVILVVVGVAIVWVAISGVLSVSLRLRAGACLLLRLLLLSLSDGVRGGVAAVLVLIAAAKSWLAVASGALRVLAEVISLRGIVASKGPLLRGNAFWLGMCSLLAEVLAVKGIWVSVLLVCGVVG